MRIRLWGAALVSACAVAVSTMTTGVAAAAPSDVVALYRDSTIVGAVPTFGGISGLDRTGNGTYVLISTDVGRFGPARTYNAHIPFLSSEGFTAGGRITGAGTVFGPNNLPILPGGAQFEGIRRVGDGFVVAGGGNHQFVRLTGPIGNHVRDLPLPAAYRVTPKSGLNGQRGLTGVAVAPGDRISAITAGGLKQDRSNSARLITWAGRGTSEHVYRTDRGNVAADVIAVNNTDYLVLERGNGRAARIYWTTTSGATPVGGKQKLSGRETPMRKKQIFSTAPLPRLVAGNMSGLAWGNWLPERSSDQYRARVLYVVTNDMFAGPTRVHGLEVHLPKR
ncbi:esterase-like activity of phytase family protein [Gordonia sp. PKS22-38]|uniref:Esterase-like activity of phytase family protein n=1 Tax=Gordonia prachuapensis TaxID=3115651 RepID=A0ABU7MR20_9ACTN|nr:esterase-like activity of phytase family protein [Gordonia sp. PKS22-38]